MPDLDRLHFYKKESVFLGVLAGIFLISYLFVFRASDQVLLKKEDQLKEMRTELGSLSRQKRVEEKLIQFGNLLEEEGRYTQVINIPGELAKKYHLNVPSVTYQKEALEGNFLRVSSTFSVTGSYEAIRSFIADLESSRSLYIIEDMSLGKSSKEGSLLELQLKVSTLLKTKI